MAAEIVSACTAEIHLTDEVVRVCLLPAGHAGPHWATRPVQPAYGPVSWTGDDKPPADTPDLARSTDGNQ